MLDLLVTNATLPDGRTHMAVAVQDGRIVEVAECLQAPAAETLDAGGPVSYTHLTLPTNREV